MVSIDLHCPFTHTRMLIGVQGGLIDYFSIGGSSAQAYICFYLLV